MVIMLVSNHFEREESELSNSVRTLKVLVTMPWSIMNQIRIPTLEKTRSGVLLVMAITQEEPNLVVNLRGYR